jgi:hypothetical protein
MANFTLKYGSSKHTEIREAIRARIRHGQHAVSKKTDDYAEDEERFMAYMPTREDDVARKVKKNEGEPQFVTLDIPYSYAILLSWHTYQTSVFLSRSPVMQFAGRHGETEQQIQAMEAIMDYQTQVGEHLVPYYIWLMDAGKYGVGIVGNYWDEEIIQVSEIAEEEVSYLGIPISGKTRKVKRTKRVKGYTGNRIYNIRPQDFIFDSRVSLLNFQKGEFCGRFTDMAWNNLVRREDYGQYYNVGDVKSFKNRNRSQSSQGGRDTGSSQLELPDAITQENSMLQDELKSPDFVSVVEMHIDLIPKDWGLGKSTYPEKWVFTLAEDEVIIESQPYDSLHGKFPYNILESEMEGYALQKHSMLETMDPLNDTLSWLVNSHLYNVRSVLNGQFIADPSRITIKDFKSEGGGRIVRLKPTAYGQDVRTMFQQINTTDVTQNHLRDAQVIAEMLQRVSQPNPGGRKTATEVRGSNAAGINRLKTQAEYFSASGWAPLSQQMIQNTQQRYDGEMKFKLAGDLAEDAGQQFINVNSDLISGFYDFTPIDGTLPIDRFAQVTMWTQLMAQMRNFPELMAGYDMGGIFAWVAQLGGLKNIKRFRLNVRPDGAILNDLQSGNVVGLDDARQSAAGNGGSPQNSTGVPGAPQLPGLGPTG